MPVQQPGLRDVEHSQQIYQPHPHHDTPHSPFPTQQPIPMIGRNDLAFAPASDQYQYQQYQYQHALYVAGSSSGGSATAQPPPSPLPPSVQFGESAAPQPQLLYMPTLPSNIDVPSQSAPHSPRNTSLSTWNFGSTLQHNGGGGMNPHAGFSSDSHSAAASSFVPGPFNPIASNGNTNASHYSRPPAGDPSSAGFYRDQADQFLGEFGKALEMAGTSNSAAPTRASAESSSSSRPPPNQIHVGAGGGGAQHRSSRPAEGNIIGGTGVGKYTTRNSSATATRATIEPNLIAAQPLGLASTTTLTSQSIASSDLNNSTVGTESARAPVVHSPVASKKRPSKAEGFINTDSDSFNPPQSERPIKRERIFTVLVSRVLLIFASS